MPKLMTVLTLLACLLLLTGNAHAQRFQDNGNGTVTDTETNLMWSKDANLFGFLEWDEAVSSCVSANVGGLSGWRLPNEEELSALVVAVQTENPFINLILHTPYWTSTENSANQNEARFINSGFGSGAFTLKSYPFFVWPVR